MPRSIFIGDIHGCSEELDALLSQVGVTSKDRVFSVGDVLARGPNSRAVLATLRRVGASAVRGNHEERLLEARRASLAGLPLPKLEESHARLLQELTADEFEWIAAWPLTLALPEHGALLVHAGLVPGWPLERHDARTLTRMRTIKKDGSPSDKLDGRLWGEVYAGPPHVIFGHNAVTGLQLHASATGLDSACVYGKKLTALVLEDGEPVPPPKARRLRLEQVKAGRAYYTYSKK
jgi:hypothetical protein